MKLEITIQYSNGLVERSMVDGWSVKDGLLVVVHSESHIIVIPLANIRSWESKTPLEASDQ